MHTTAPQRQIIQVKCLWCQGGETLVHTKLQLSLVMGQKELPGGPYNPTLPFIINDVTNGPTNAARAAQMSTPPPPRGHLSQQWSSVVHGRWAEQGEASRG